jgi:hypothetical protein
VLMLCYVVCVCVCLYSTEMLENLASLHLNTWEQSTNEFEPRQQQQLKKMMMDVCSLMSILY